MKYQNRKKTNLTIKKITNDPIYLIEVTKLELRANTSECNIFTLTIQMSKLENQLLYKSSNPFNPVLKIVSLKEHQ